MGKYETTMEWSDARIQVRKFIAPHLSPHHLVEISHKGEWHLVMDTNDEDEAHEMARLLLEWGEKV